MPQYTLLTLNQPLTGFEPQSLKTTGQYLKSLVDGPFLFTQNQPTCFENLSIMPQIRFSVGLHRRYL